MQKFYHLIIFWLAQALVMQLFAQNNEEYVKTHYQKAEYQIPMRDGVKLFATVYTPKDAGKDNKYPILMQRTCYNVGPYGADKYESLLGPSKYTMEEKYIFVYQDVRGRWMSEGSFDNMRPQIPAGSKTTQKDIDESTDTYDTIDWLLKNLKFHNGKVGQWGISYPGFYAAVGTLARHPALKASSPQAPIADFFFDDFHHQGAFILGYFMTFPVFGVQKDKNTTESWYNDKFPKPSRDYYDFLLNMGSLKNAEQYYKDNFFWQEIVNHPNYDEFWQKRNLLPHLRNIKHAVLTVGGWFDAEDLYGPLNIYKTIEKNNPGIYNQIVMGPWTHGDWARTPKEQIIGNIHFGTNISDYYQREIEAKFFKQHLKGGEDAKIAEATLFDTGKKEWRSFDKWPAANAKKAKLYFHEKEKLAIDQAPAANGFAEFISDPHNPVPYAEDLGVSFTPRKYMTDDQREASRRPDVVVFQTDVLTEDITLGGEILAKLKVSVSGTDSDWIVKLIDVMPDTAKASEQTPKTTKLAGYQMLVRSEMMRGRFRNSFEKPEPFVSNQITEVKFPLQDVLHTFKKGHRIMIQVHSTWFPIIDRNPQKYVDNIYKAEDADFTKAMHRVYHANDNASYIEVEILDK